jgi:peptide/nickel transport system substrate-binding protein
VLSICLGEEPRSLFIYGDQSSSARIIRQALYDGPVDRVNFEEIPILLEVIPDQENSLVNTAAVEVHPGQKMVDARGNITFLASGVEYRPAGCTSPDCWEVYSGQTAIELDQAEIQFQMQTGVSWGDGTPVTPVDSLFSFQTASKIYGSSGPAKLRYTASYELNEEEVLIWKGLPGYLGLYSYSDFFFIPLPQHQLENFTLEELLSAPQTNLQPLGWGAYQVQEWIPGDHITLRSNPYYLNGDESLPGFDILVFRFPNSGEEALAAVLAGECQIAANEPDLINYQSQLVEYQEAGELSLHMIEGNAWEQVSFGINSIGRNRTLLQDPELRQTLVSCVDRERISQDRLDAGMVVDSFSLPSSLGESQENIVIPYQPAAAGLQLNDMGWIDRDGDPASPRISEGVEGIPDGTQLQLTLLAADAQARSITLDHLQEGLENCGVGVEIQTMPAAVLLSAGPDGPVFGRNFDLAYFAWAAGNYQPCRLFISDEIPGIYPEQPKGWGGVNASGYSNQNFDRACQIVSTNLPDSDLAREAAVEVSEIFKSDLPVIPLFFRRDLIISRPEITGLENGYFDPLWNIEDLR